MKKTLKNNKQALIAGLVLIALVVAYFKREQIKDFFSKSSTAPSNNAPVLASYTTTPKPSSTANYDTILSKGSTGDQVRKLQQLLNDKHRQHTPTFIPLLVEDGQFGSKTETMLKKYTGKTSISINQFIKTLS